MQEYEDLKVLVSEIEADIDKAEGGNKAAGTRVPRTSAAAFSKSGRPSHNQHRYS
jgi:hypothetical protein